MQNRDRKPNNLYKICLFDPKSFGKTVVTWGKLWYDEFATIPKEETTMGIIKTAVNALGGTLADQWLETIEPFEMGDNTVMTCGVSVRRDDRRNGNRKGSQNIITDGSVIHVYPNQFMMLMDGGKIIDYTAEEGYYQVNNSSAPSLFNGSLGDSVKDFFERVKFGGATPTAQKVYFINLQEIKGIKFGTRNPINYFDNMYNAELFLRAHGTYSIRITDPLRFYYEAVPRNQEVVDIKDINEQYLSEFLDALQSAINQMSADGIRISYVASKSRELSKYMADILDEDWKKNRGMEIQSVGLASISYDEESKKLINMRNQGAMLSDAAVREGYVQGAMARGIEAAGSNANGSMAGFMGINMGMNAGAGMAGVFSQANQQQMQAQMAQQQAAQQAAAQQQAAQAAGWTCSCGAQNPENAKFCAQCGNKKPEAAGGWICQECGTKNTGKFCMNCGKPRPVSGKFHCNKCGFEMDNSTGMKFCPECGDPITPEDFR